jgi:threonine dehydratase
MITLTHIRRAVDVIKPFVLKTPLVHSPTLSRRFKADVFLKLENLQKTGSFKIRGAANKIFSQKNAIGPAGVVAASAGNHAQGVALAARHAHIPAVIVMPRWASISKQEATRNYGGEVILFGDTITESLAKARDLALEGRTLIHPFDDADVIAGQGAIGLEILEDMKDADMIVVPVGGGGLIAGIALAAKTLRPEIKIIGVQAAACPAVHDSLKRGRISKTTSKGSIADGINVQSPGKIPFAILKKYVDEVVLVEEDPIAEAVLTLLERKKILAEGAGAVSLAALMSGAVRVPENSRVVLLISGGNVDSPVLGRIISHGLMENGRIIRFGVSLEDRPGTLAKLLTFLAELNVNVLHISHERYDKGLPLYESRVLLEVETRNREHIHEMLSALGERGYFPRLRGLV